MKFRKENIKVSNSRLINDKLFKTVIFEEAETLILVSLKNMKNNLDNRKFFY
jgi:hypothetical protein